MRVNLQIEAVCTCGNLMQNLSRGWGKAAVYYCANKKCPNFEKKWDGPTADLGENTDPAVKMRKL